MNSSLSLSLARALALFWGKDRNIERETKAEIGRRREKWAQRIPLSLLVMRGCRGAVAAPNYYQAAATARSNGPCRAAAEAHQYEEREREREEKGRGHSRPNSPRSPLAPCRCHTNWRALALSASSTSPDRNCRVVCGSCVCKYGWKCVPVPFYGCVSIQECWDNMFSQ